MTRSDYAAILIEAKTSLNEITFLGSLLLSEQEVPQEVKDAIFGAEDRIKSVMVWATQERYSINTKLMEVNQAKEVVRKKQQEFKDAQRKLSELMGN